MLSRMLLHESCSHEVLLLTYNEERASKKIRTMEIISNHPYAQSELVLAPRGASDRPALKGEEENGVIEGSRGTIEEKVDMCKEITGKPTSSPVIPWNDRPCKFIDALPIDAATMRSGLNDDTSRLPQQKTLGKEQLQPGGYRSGALEVPKGDAPKALSTGGIFNKVFKRFRSEQRHYRLTQRFQHARLQAKVAHERSLGPKSPLHVASPRQRLSHIGADLLTASKGRLMLHASRSLHLLKPSPRPRLPPWPATPLADRARCNL